MIDTDKYEGHTPGPWGRDYDSVFEYGGEDIARLTLGNEANEQLVADAPLLLQEVKRLRRVNDDLICDLEGFQEAVKEDEAGYKDLVASLEGIEEELKVEVKRLNRFAHCAMNFMSKHDLHFQFLNEHGVYTAPDGGRFLCLFHTHTNGMMKPKYQVNQFNSQ